ncbi:glutamine--fructose-6-phosphate transaminase (isomerizing) [Candidatus Heimdallarchaeota archaeon]|nr:MAG: glutamine--fructose-6-phosphate transaminase (isomerizing) [Candidatus Heimdallarchaeota archaeon]
MLKLQAVKNVCGIIGYIGKKDATPLLLESLKRLEYRGYDSCGIACVMDDSNIAVRKGAGRINEVSQKKRFEEVKSHLGIAHTRWATHGKVSDENAHPFVSCDGKYALVHNGILENYHSLKEDLLKKGHTFSSETDTEVLVHLLEEKLNHSENADILTVVQEIVEEAKGAYTFLLLRKDTKEIIAFRKDSPLILGLAEDGYYASSDIMSFLPYTNKTIILKNNQMAILRNKSLQLFNVKTGKELTVEPTIVDWTPEQASKSGYPHFMLKEIFEETEVSKLALEQSSERMQKMLTLLQSNMNLLFLGSGTSYRACYLASIYFTKMAGKKCQAILGSEYKTYHNIVDKNTIIFAVSQSGETADVLEGIRLAKEKGATIVSLVNVLGSTIRRESDFYLTLNAGPEIAVASTKAFTSQVLVLLLLAYGLSNKLQEGRKELQSLIDLLPEVMDLSPTISQLAADVMNQRDLYLIGRSTSYPVAMEGELKIKEIAYIHADALAGGELKHHTLALIEKGVPCIALVPNDSTKDDMLNNIMQIKSRGGIIIGISSLDLEEFDYHIPLPAHPLETILMIPVLQLISYHLAVLRGNDPDFPRNLAKSVTVL